MNLTDLPADLLQLVFSYLPMDDRIRTSRVNKQFSNASKLAISATKTLHLSDTIFDRLTYLYPASLASLLSLCSPRIEKTKFPCNPWPMLVSTFAQFHYPALNDLDLDSSVIDPDLFDQLIRNSPNLERLIWAIPHPMYLRYPSFISEKLQSLKVSRFDDQSIQSLTGNCPNLTVLETLYMGPMSMTTLEPFFATVPNLQSFIVSNFCGRFPINGTHFWRLKSLHTLIMHWYSDRDRRITDYFLQRIAESFPELKILELDMMGLTNEGVASLASLKNLRRLTLLESHRRTNNDLDAGISALIDRLQLEELRTESVLSPRTFTNILRFCNDLRFLEIDYVFHVHSATHTAQLVRSVSPLRDSKLTISVMDPDSASYWKSNAVKIALDHINPNGHMIIFQ